MPAKNEKQARLFRMALGVKRGNTKLSSIEDEDTRESVNNIIKDMSEKEIKKFTKVSAMKDSFGLINGKVLVITSFDKEYIDLQAEKKKDGKKTAKFRKQILKVGTFEHPNRPGEKVTFSKKIFDKIVKAFNDNVIDTVPVIIDGHEESVLKTVGRVTSLEATKDSLFAIVELSDEKVIAGIESKLSDGKGVIDEVSVSLGGVTKDDGTKVPIVLLHLAIVPHAWFRGMKSFEKITAALKSGNIKMTHLVQAEDLQKKIWKVRSAFNKQFPSLPGSFKWVEEIHDAFIIVNNDDGTYTKYNYTTNKNRIEFDDGKLVEKEFKEVKATVDIKELLAALKENGLEFENIDDLKAALNKEVKPSDADIDVAAQNKVVKILTEAGLIDKKDSKKESFNVEAAVKDIVNKNKSLTEDVEKLKEEQINAKAESAVKELMNAGKIIPANKEHYVNLYKKDEELFNSLTADLPIRVQFKENGSESSDQEFLSENDAEKEVEAAYKSVSPNGKKSK